MDQTRFRAGLHKRPACTALCRLATLLLLITGGDAVRDFATGVADAIYDEMPRR
ncbi:MAG TPA: hypothetical protein VD865_07065 [Stenotrophomonas sp.]|nr:hypothetical protein [Stenotrophomonas sp.]